MATTGQALSALAGSVTKTASTVTNIVGTIDASVSIVNNYVQRHLAQQETKNAIELAIGKIRLEEDSALEVSERRIEINNRLKDADFAAVYAAALSEIKAITRPVAG